jgi:ABC-type sugar transport system permease subunit
MGYASAIAVTLFVVISIVTLLQLWPSGQVGLAQAGNG